MTERDLYLTIIRAWKYKLSLVAEPENKELLNDLHRALNEAEARLEVEGGKS